MENRPVDERGFADGEGDGVDGQAVEKRREPSGEAAWDTFSKGYGPTRSLAASLDPARRGMFHEAFAAFHDGFRTELGICVPREYLVTVGVRM